MGCRRVVPHAYDWMVDRQRAPLNREVPSGRAALRQPRLQLVFVPEVLDPSRTHDVLLCCLWNVRSLAVPRRSFMKRLGAGGTWWRERKRFSGDSCPGTVRDDLQPRALVVRWSRLSIAVHAADLLPDLVGAWCVRDPSAPEHLVTFDGPAPNIDPSSGFVKDGATPPHRLSAAGPTSSRAPPSVAGRPIAVHAQRGSACRPRQRRTATP